MINSFFDNIIEQAGKDIVAPYLQSNGNGSELLASIKKEVKQCIKDLSRDTHTLFKLIEANRQLFFMELGYDIEIPEYILKLNQKEILAAILGLLPNINNPIYEISYNAFNEIITLLMQLNYKVTQND